MNEINNQLKNMCSGWEIPFAKHNETIRLDIHLNESKLHLYNYNFLKKH